MRPHFDGVYGRAYALTGSTQDAEDLVQEVCIRASSRFAEVLKHENPRAWLMTVLYRLFVDLARGRRRSPLRLVTREDSHAWPEAVPSTEPGPEQQADASTYHKRLSQAWERLTNDEQWLLALYGIEGLSLTEIQDVTGLSAEKSAASSFGETSNAL
jgi:RNA polymerase sigma-70 factor (ECF subfamily)